MLHLRRKCAGENEPQPGFPIFPRPELRPERRALARPRCVMGSRGGGSEWRVREFSGPSRRPARARHGPELHTTSTYTRGRLPTLEMFNRLAVLPRRAPAGIRMFSGARPMTRFVQYPFDKTKMDEVRGIPLPSLPPVSAPTRRAAGHAAPVRQERSGCGLSSCRRPRRPGSRVGERERPPGGGPRYSWRPGRAVPSPTYILLSTGQFCTGVCTIWGC